MAKNKINPAMLRESWGRAIKTITNNAVNESSEKFDWMCEYAHNHTMALNEEAVGGASFPFNTLYNTNGIGNAVPAQQAGMTAADQASRASVGSGDKWPALLPMALQVAARTIGFDLVNTIPLQGPTGVLPFLDYVYAGSKDAYGATPAYNGATANPAAGTRLGEKVDPAYSLYDAPHMFRCKASATGKTKAEVLALIATYDASNGRIDITKDSTTLKVQYIGASRVNADPMFRVLPESKGVALGTVFGTEASVDVTLGSVTVTLKFPRLVSALEDQVQGFTGAGQHDADRWHGTFQDGTYLYEPMDRATGEMQYPRQMSLKVFTKFVQAGTQSVAVAVTQEQVQDLQKQWGIDVLKLVENAAINELSQSINKHILSRLFSLGWKNHVRACESEGINLNVTLDSSVAGVKSFAIYDEDQTQPYLAEMDVPALTNFGAFENFDTVCKKLFSLVLTAGNVIMNRGRRGPANFIVTNAKVASLLQSGAQYGFSPIANTINQTNGSLYPAGQVAGMTVYVDPYMKFDDTRILVGRKGDKQEPGVVFCPYIIAESVRLIAEQTASPKVIVKSRYDLVDTGFYPELNYLTIFVKTPAGLI